MIEVSVTESSIKISGHAGYAEPGKDIVCAAVSTLWQNLILSLDHLTDDDYDTDTEGEVKSIKFWTLSDRAWVLKMSFLHGIEAIAESYPDNVRLSTSNYYRQ